ncbi:MULTISPECIES: hypothetical protein [unclassified Nocardioides]|uniref:hypothetical protein n=1 Tax=unclassified Nocardioides TaxID=2615069 RepID=UPI0002F50E2E|nr:MULTISPECIES: hypothetical protein [unclassified Nocardioides]
MTITALLMAGLMAFVLLVPTLMVAILVSGIARRPEPAEAAPVTGQATGPVTGPVAVPVAVPVGARATVTRPTVELRAS